MLDLTWRFAVSDASSGRLITLLDRRSTARKVTRTLNKTSVATGTVPADNPEINLVLGDGFPFLSEGVRNIYGFRKEVDLPSAPWVVRFGGRVLMLEDNVEETSGAPYTNWTAYDPRQLLYTRPVLTATGDLPGPNGVRFDDTPADEIVVALIQRTIDANGEVGIDLTGGTITPCPETDFHFEQGVSVGEALDQLADANYADVFMDPVYDPVTRPGIMAELSVYPLRARIRHHAVFAWDQPSRSLVAVNRLIDGTQRANRVQFYAGQGGPAAVQVSDPTSVATYGEYWAQQFFPGQNFKSAAEELANEQLLVRKNGAITFRVNPAPAQATISTPVTLLDYDVGDCVPIYASSRFREAVNTVKRVYELPIALRDDGTETVEQLSFAEGVCEEDE